MHPNSMTLMKDFRNNNIDKIRGKRVLDVGSQDINGSYRQMFEEVGCEYIGADIIPGNNVDVLILNPSDLPFPANDFDVVICGQVLEHAERPWILAIEMARVLKVGGLACWIAPWRFQVHKESNCPFDRWRILDDGMKVLMTDAGIKVIECRMHEDDTIGIGEKA